MSLEKEVFPFMSKEGEMVAFDLEGQIVPFHDYRTSVGAAVLVMKMLTELISC